MPENLAADPDYRYKYDLYHHTLRAIQYNRRKLEEYRKQADEEEKRLVENEALAEGLFQWLKERYGHNGPQAV